MDIIREYPVVILLASGLVLLGLSALAYARARHLASVLHVIYGWDGNSQAIKIASEYLRTHAATRQSLNFQRFFLTLGCAAGVLLGIVLMMLVFSLAVNS